ncbi:MAG: pilus assembly protein PilZ [Sphingopyxis sp. RIFCSPHIGHO2_01_FULL_65_24]|nr:MAG: pilus assembly protein PilZ [Sphingopyxis sp. RIFCSPHIGHO2_01_FULL_65_24]
MNEPRFSAPGEDQDGDADADRRGGDRFRTVWRIAKVIRDGDAGLWRVRNMSDGGMMLAVEVPVSVGERLEIALSETIVIQGRVAWCEEGRCGVAFDAAVDGNEVLRQLAAEQQSGDYRAPRLPVHTRAQLITDGAVSDIELADLSQSGAGFLHDVPMEVGKALELVLPGDIRRQAIVRWSRGGRGGLWLTEPLGRADLESIRHFKA